MLRSTLDEILKLIAECDDEDRRVKLYNALYTGTQRLLTAMRTHTILVGDNQELLTSFWEAVAMFRKDKGIAHPGSNRCRCTASLPNIRNPISPLAESPP